MWSLRAGLIVFWVVLFGCGYSLRGRPPGFSPAWRTIYVEIFQNRTSETRAGVWLSEALRRRFARSGFVKLVDSPEKADLVLSGEIKRLTIGGISYDVYTETLQRRVSVRVAARMRSREGRLIWQNENLSRYENYPVEGTASGLLDPGREAALRKLAEDLAEIIYHQITASF